MLEWLEASLATNPPLTVGEVALRLLLSLALGGIVAGIFVLTQKRSRSELLPMATTLVLLTVLIAMVTLVIGNNVARAFSLAGALAIIRFRTVVEDTRDTAFVIFAVVVGMGVGADLIVVPLVGIPVIALAAFSFGLWGRTLPLVVPEYSLSIRLGLGRDPALFKEIFAKRLTLVRLRATATARQGSALEMTYQVRLACEEDAATLVSDLNRLDGVQNVELRQI